MKAASVSDIKSALKNMDAAELTALCLRLARARKENKELLTYLLFEEQDQAAYINSIKSETEEGINAITTSNLYLVKKSLRRVLRLLNKYIKYSGQKETEAELLIHFCQTVREAGLPLHRSGALAKLYDIVHKKAKAAVDTLHEDLQYDYLRKLAVAGPLSPGGGAQVK